MAPLSAQKAEGEGLPSVIPGGGLSKTKAFLRSAQWVFFISPLGEASFNQI
ncbi:MAG: hypothetical protein O6939_06880 [Bacteroidetes bacterium]|nr:hypothetical protein [Bacteroidota bacterium]